MDFINKIGQRNIAKILVVISACSCFLGFMIEKVTDFKAISFGVFLFLLPNLILSLVAHKNKDYRLFSIIASIVLIILNNMLFFLNFKMILFIALIIQIVILGIFYTIVHVLENKKREEYRERKRKMKNSDDSLSSRTIAKQRNANRNTGGTRQSTKEAEDNHV